MKLLIGLLVIVLSAEESHHTRVLTYIDGYRSALKYHQQGNVNLIVSAPHGGDLKPSDVPDRTPGGCRRQSGLCTWWFNDTCTDGTRCAATTVRDLQTAEFAELVANELMIQYSLKPFVVIGQWHRVKVDFNREVNEATLNHPEAINAHRDYHSNIQQAVTKIQQRFGKGLLLDIHGHAAGNYTMVGYLLTNDHLNRNDLNTLSVPSSVDLLCKSDRESCIRGQDSFGTIFEANGLGIAYPSQGNPKPGSLTFLAGGHITKNYIASINAIQTELPSSIRTGDRYTNARNYARTVVQYMKRNNFLLTD